MISEQQIKMIWALARQVGLDNDGLHELIEGLTGKKSIGNLTNTDVSLIIEKLTNAGARIKKKREIPKDLPGNVVEMITLKQKKLIKYFNEKLAWQDNPDRLKGFSKRIIKKEMAATKEEGTRLILAMRAMVNKKTTNRPVEGCQ